MARAAVAGVGALVVNGQDVSVVYDLVPSPEGDHESLEGTLSGDPTALRDAFLRAEHELRLDNGASIRVVLLNVSASGVADVHAARTAGI